MLQDLKWQCLGLEMIFKKWGTFSDQIKLSMFVFYLENYRFQFNL